MAVEMKTERLGVIPESQVDELERSIEELCRAVDRIGTSGKCDMRNAQEAMELATKALQSRDAYLLIASLNAVEIISQHVVGRALLQKAKAHIENGTRPQRSTVTYRGGKPHSVGVDHA